MCRAWLFLSIAIISACGPAPDKTGADSDKLKLHSPSPVADDGSVIIAGTVSEAAIPDSNREEPTLDGLRNFSQALESAGDIRFQGAKLVLTKDTVIVADRFQMVESTIMTDGHELKIYARVMAVDTPSRFGSYVDPSPLSWREEVRREPRTVGFPPVRRMRNVRYLSYPERRTPKPLTITLAGQISGIPTFRLAGGTGAKGFPGSAGSAGANGKNGRQAKERFGVCRSGPGDGGNGQQGSKGKSGQSGQQGGDGGTLVVRYVNATPQPEILRNFLAPSGSGGAGGDGGPGGAGGKGGDGGKSNNACGGKGRPGKDGPAGPMGDRGPLGLPGVSGNARVETVTIPD
jgi:hypothetical protein